MGEALDGVRCGFRREGIDCTVDDTVATVSKNLDKLERTIVDVGAERRRCGRGRSLRGGDHGGRKGEDGEGRGREVEMFTFKDDMHAIDSVEGSRASFHATKALFERY